MTERLGVVGGSGIYDFDGFEELERIGVETPFGDPSDEFVVGQIGEREVVFLPRHGRGHRLLPGELPARANIWAFKKLGVSRIISVSAVGSMREEIEPGHLVLPDQFIDRTRGRPSSFFGQGIAGHVGFADPVCADMVGALQRAASDEDITVHHGGAYVCIEGPQFSTRAESLTYRSWGVSVVGMTNLPEARLAREAEICYATLALATDYDCWHQGEDDVSVEAVVAVLKSNVANAQRLIKTAIAGIASGPRTCPCATALDHAIMTAPDAIPAERRADLAPILDRVMPVR